ncbi:hypothetical protein EI94DRAFT_1508544, partial [Lactarius quietus]
IVWPSNLGIIAMFNTLHSLETSDAERLGGISCRCFFTFVFIGYFFYNTFVSLDLLAYLRVLTTPKISSKRSLSHAVWPWPMGVLRFAWGQSTAVTGSPLPILWWAAANNGISVVFFSWFLFPILYYTTTWYGAFLP